MDLLIGSAFAIVISIYLIFIKEKYKNKNYKDLWLSILSGSLMSLSALFFQLLLMSFFNLNDFLEAFLSAAFIEEVSKFLITYYVIIKSAKNLSSYDTIKIFLLASLTFALLENIIYVNLYYRDFGMDTALIRMFTAIPMHAICGISMGYFLFNYNKFKNKLFLFISIFIPILVHGSYDYFILVDSFIFSFFILIATILAHIKPAKHYFT